jgi:hypothetical protein
LKQQIKAATKQKENKFARIDIGRKMKVGFAIGRRKMREGFATGRKTEQIRIIPGSKC